MARNVRSAQLETRTARLKLELRKKPYMVRVAPGVRLGYRRNASAGTWSVIAAGGKNAEEDDPGRPAIVREALAAYQADLIARGGDVHNVSPPAGSATRTTVN